MDETATTMHGDNQVATLLRRELARGDQALAGVPPVLGHMLSGNAPALVTDDILAHIRGMLMDLAKQLVRAEATASRLEASRDELAERGENLAAHLSSSSIILSFAFAIAIEGQSAQELQERTGVDQVLPPLMQELIASDDDAIAELAMGAMAAQARFIQGHRRMSLPLSELPAELFHEILRSWSHFARDVSPATKTQVEALLRAEYDESGSRAGKLGRLVSKLHSGARVALAIDHAGFALFATALSSLSKQPREMAVLSCHASQIARLVLGLRAAGLGRSEIAETFLVIHPNQALPTEFEQIDQAQAHDLLAGSGVGAS